MKVVKVVLVCFMCLSLAGCPIVTLIQGTLATVGLACSPETKAVMGGIKDGLVGIIAKAKTYLEQLKEERDQATEPGIIEALTKAIDKATNVLNGAENLYKKACKALSLKEWLSSWNVIKVEEIQMDVQYKVSMEMARKARLAK